MLWQVRMSVEMSRDFLANNEVCRSNVCYSEDHIIEISTRKVRV